MALERTVVDGTTLDARQRRVAFATVLVAFTLEIVDSTIVNTALPSIRASLGASDAEMQWIVAGYFLTLGSLLLLGGRLGDAFGYRRVFLGGVGAFVAASALCGLAQTPEQLIVARLLQGIAGAVMGPQVMAIIQKTKISPASGPAFRPSLSLSLSLYMGCAKYPEDFGWPTHALAPKLAPGLAPACAALRGSTVGLGHGQLVEGGSCDLAPSLRRACAELRPPTHRHAPREDLLATACRPRRQGGFLRRPNGL